ncbi:MAG: hypothetical protein H0X44_06455 [Acidobacteria bacterium]|nr:hypothetical protein [Acidobacteriota bacterium]
MSKEIVRMASVDQQPLPTVRQLLRAILVAVAIAGVILIVAVLPAEYGIDPTGMGRRLGLLRPADAPAPTAAAPDAVAPTGEETGVLGQAVMQAPDPFRSDQVQVTLAWREGIEVKAHMRRGQRFVFSWVSDGGPVDVDMHGEAVNAPSGEYTSYWKVDQQSSGHGAFEAPFDGTHGWFWQNFSETPVTITVKTSGYYQKIGRPE